MRDQDGEDPQVTARRELEEEAGFTAGTMIKLGSHESAPGISNSVVHLFVAIDLVKTHVDRHGPEEQFMTIESPLFTEALEMIKSGVISDGKTVIGLLLVAQNFSRLL
jgi:ADP-ribose pyrophosphatase